MTITLVSRVGAIVLGVSLFAQGAAPAVRSQATIPAPAMPPTAAISGVVTDGLTGKPVSDATVLLRAPDQSESYKTSEMQFTDARGRFVFTGLAAGQGYVVGATKAGYFQAWYGARGYGMLWANIAITDDAWFSSANITLWRPGGISGTVFDERGEPVAGVFVRAISEVMVAGQKQYAVGPLATTDDRGVYRIANLTPGRYLAMVPSVQSSTSKSAAAQPGSRGDPVPALDVDRGARLLVGQYAVPPPPSGGQRFAYPPTFSGGATSITQATSVELTPGRDAAALDVRLVPVPAARVSGFVQGPADALTNLTLRMLGTGMESLGLGSEIATTQVAADGAFVFPSVPSGTYTIDVPTTVASFVTGSSALTVFYGARQPSPPGTSLSTVEGLLDVGPPGVGFSSSTLRGQRFTGRTAITVGAQNLSNIVVALHAATTVAGRLVGEADPSRPAPATPPRYVNLDPAMGDSKLGRLASEYSRNTPPGEFAVSGVLPGLYFVRGNDSTWMVKSVMVEGQDYTDRPLDLSNGQSLSGVVVTFTNAPASIAGVVHDDRGVLSSNAAVIAFPVEREQWTSFGLAPARIKRARTSTNGSYHFTRLPAGAYYLVALPEAQVDAWQEPAFFARASARATTVTVKWNDKVQLDLVVQ